MAIIENAVLSITDGANPSEAKIKVECTVKPSQSDSDNHQSYRLDAEIIGVDKIPGEDNNNDVITPGLGFGRRVTFFSSEPKIIELSGSVSKASLNEDPSFGFTRDDEIQAKVRLKPIINTTFKNSNVIVLSNVLNA